MKRASLLVLAVLCLAPRAAAATEIQYLGMNPSQLVNVSLTGYWNGLTMFAGEIDWKWKDATPAGYNPIFYGYCTDLLVGVTSMETVDIRATNLLVVNGVPDAGGKAAWLFNTYAPVVHENSITPGYPPADSKTEAAALQIAIWEALYDTSPDLSGGDFRLNGSAAVAAKAMQYLAMLYSGGPNGYHTSQTSWLDAQIGHGQDQMVMMPVPEPASLALCGLGLVGIARAVRRRRRAA